MLQKAASVLIWHAFAGHYPAEPHGYRLWNEVPALPGHCAQVSSAKGTEACTFVPVQSMQGCWELGVMQRQRGAEIGVRIPLLLRSDLKGANVLIKSVKATEKDPRGYVCKLADFGLARVLGSNRTHVSTSSHGEQRVLAVTPKNITGHVEWLMGTPCC